MRALIVYASWFGHTRAIASQIASVLAAQHHHVVCAPVSRIGSHDLIGNDLLVLGSYTHAHHASWRLHTLIDSIPERRLAHVAVAVFGTQAVDRRPSGVDDLVAALRARGHYTVVPPLRIALTAPDFAPWSQIGPAEKARVDAFAAELANQLALTHV